MRFKFALIAASACLTASAWSAAAAPPSGLPPPPTLSESPRNGDWVFSQTRNTPEIKEAAAEGCRFNLDRGGGIRWEIPTLHEVVAGKIDGLPMPIHRPVATNLTLSVSSDGPRVLLYKVARAGKPEGEGRMTLVDQGKAWVDISQPAGRPDLAGAVVYVRPSEAFK